ncbi:terminase family protein [Sphingomonas sp. BK235]|uniref:DNA-packaging protein n=1 Tax=Sphingomonas sp. BK235 TaxID=2512131 RepID=UPI001045473F|nr:terminase family protein [Sphingomonas sp. BK235]TCP33598.1 phage terminase large subunit-like protein [Sphingomonas sp. BK235]
MTAPLRHTLAALHQVAAAERARIIGALDPVALRRLLDEWAAWAHPGQLAPAGDWRVWLLQAGRGFGKTRAGAEWVSAMARAVPAARIALVGATLDDARQVMVEGPSGVLAVARHGEPVAWRPAAGELRFASGASARVYSAAAPESLRGPEHHFAWADELGKWAAPAAWDNLLLGLRAGAAPRALVTTTPRATLLLRRLVAATDTAVTRGRTRDNPHLPAAFVRAVEASYGGTRLGRQELDGELIADAAGALWPRALIERQRAAHLPALVRVVVGVDPPAGSEGDACGIVAAALGRDGNGYVLEDASLVGASPERWARAVAACAARNAAERVVAEANQGGDMVAQVLRAADAALPLRLVHATRGKVARAEPVAALYEAGRVWHARAFPALEDELAGLVAGGGYAGPGRSPDRADACVWALTALLLGEGGGWVVRVRVL